MMLDAKSKYRLIGAGLLIVSSAVLLPLVLDGERPESLDVQITVPEKPAFPEVVIAPVQPIDELSDHVDAELPDPNTIQLISEEATPSAAPEASEPVPESKPKQVAIVEKPVEVKKEVSPVEARWTLQVATFGKKDNASRTLKRLQDAGYPAYVMTSNSLFKVFVGPELKREASEKVKNKILKEFKLSGIVVKYSPNS